MEEIAMESFCTFKIWKYLKTYLGIPEDQQIGGTPGIDPHVIVGDRAFRLKTYLVRPYRDCKAKGTMRRASSIIGLPEPEEWWNMHLEY